MKPGDKITAHHHTPRAISALLKYSNSRTSNIKLKNRKVVLLIATATAILHNKINKNEINTYLNTDSIYKIVQTKLIIPGI